MREVFPAGPDDPGSSSEDHVVEYIRGLLGKIRTLAQVSGCDGPILQSKWTGWNGHWLIR